MLYMGSWILMTISSLTWWMWRSKTKKIFSNVQHLYWKLDSSLSTSNNWSSLIHFLNLQKVHNALSVPSEHDPKKAKPILRKASTRFVTNLTNSNEIRLKFSTVWHKWSHTVENYLILCSPLILLPCRKQLSNTINYFSTLLIHGHYRMIKTRRRIAPLVFRGLSTPLLSL